MAFETTKITLDPELVCRENQDGTVIVMKVDDSDNFFKIDGVAALIWNQLNNHKSLNEAYQSILEQYDVEASKLESDIQHFIETLSSKELITLH
jgi:hypothetical protein